MSLLQQGRVQVAFLGAAEVDRFGNLNTTWGRRDGKDVRLPGSGGACDLASLAQRTVILIPHERSRLVERVAFLTSPGFGTGKGWRRAQGLPANSGPSAIVTTKGVLRFGADGEAFLAAVHPGVTVEGALDSTGWPLRTANKIDETPPPSAEEFAAIRALDPHRFWTAALRARDTDDKYRKQTRNSGGRDRSACPLGLDGFARCATRADDSVRGGL